MTAVPGNLNLIMDGVEGFYLRDEADLIRAARTLLKDHDLRKVMGAAAQKLVQNRFAVENEWSAYAELYRELLS
jgi:glycosyltransferase involved in cell wall biosynthesis